MKSRRIRTVTPAAAALAAFAFAAAVPAAAPPSAKAPLELSAVTLRTRHRVFANFQEDRRVRPREVFQVGDTEYRAQIVRFVPDFAMDSKRHKVATRSHEPNNPAVQIIVKEKGAAQDTSWAFLNFPPHFSRNSLLAFQILKLEFKNHPPVVPKDSTVARPSAGAPAAAASKARTGKK